MGMAYEALSTLARCSCASCHVKVHVQQLGLLSQGGRSPVVSGYLYRATATCIMLQLCEGGVDDVQAMACIRPPARDARRCVCVHVFVLMHVCKQLGNSHFGW